LVKNSETDISRWRAPISTAETAGAGFEAFADDRSATPDLVIFGFAFGVCFGFGLDLRVAREALSRWGCDRPNLL
jgi:hypothetical protein